ncbi:opioid growth factor receptor-related protein [Lonepinella sp. BR2882]|uniref:opioid growth factor receptor-related protein n=1 Tax=Lonepinella sp. BR2882 TaxID=3095283 RepID=UPI003F6E2F90
MHPVIEFYLDQRKSEMNFSFEQMLAIEPLAIELGYFWIPWFFPVLERSKWNKKMPLLSPDEIEFFKQNEQIQQRFLQAFDAIMAYFEIQRNGTELTITETLTQRSYWLKNIGHQQKKISRIIRSLKLLGQELLARNLQQLAIKLGQEKGYLLPDTLEIWQGIFED